MTCRAETQAEYLTVDKTNQFHCRPVGLPHPGKKLLIVTVDVIELNHHHFGA
jgi:hypothetical protein